MQSDFAVFCRAAIMLSALVGLPFLAIRGLDRPMPPFVAGLIDRVTSLAEGDHTGEKAAKADEKSSGPSTIGVLRNEPAPAPWASGDHDEYPAAAPAAPGLAAAETASEPASSGWPGGVRQASATTDDIAVETELGAEQQIEQRLRRLGATRYLLEKWGEGQGLYRFQCEIPFLQVDGFHRHFEAVADNRLSAMRQVLEQVESRQTACAEGETGLR